MATLDEIWLNRSDLRFVAYRAGTLKYVALGHNTAQNAIVNALDITAEDASASDWAVGEVVADEHGQVVAIEPR